ncbi:flagellar basal-body MS-ring/collar protein FliF [Albibacillus kandeliae]|uniref:flagellar basal-body MS-ring/collar protein FliF n=1 Tax=Albibacillus kandeliae TaxID=2174228 RepID=UPI000D69F320|nr:flagellar basal-body MS-ring/collar protein FliF [Albibacillus kandeliae]
MQKIFDVWNGLDMRRRVIIVLAGVALAVTLMTMSRLATAPNMTLLYAGLEAGAAGDVVRALEQRATPFEIRGGSIYVPAAERDELRLVLASEGLPMTGGRGYELLDQLNGFGTTSQMFDAAYWRAKEGELARTIVASPFVSQARVHIANNGSNPFQRAVTPTASVSVVPAGVPITQAQANALRYLVASAVSGLTVDKVAIIDANGSLLGPADSAEGPASGDDRAQLLRDRVQRLVEARVGAGNAVVEVSVDTVTETESIRERRFDPEGRVAISTDTEEKSDSAKNDGAGDVTVASNLPDGQGAGNQGSSSQASETRERVNYEVSETEHEILRAPGAVKRLTVAVLVNGLTTTDASGATVFAERPAEELDAMRDLVASAVGFQEERGDRITIRSMDLPAAEPLGTAAGQSLLQQVNLDLMSLIQMGLLALVAAILGLFVLRPILTRAPVALPGTGGFPALPGAETEAAGPALTGEIDDGDFDSLPSFGMANGGGADGGGMPGFAMAGEDPVQRLRNMIGERQEETVEILRSWLEDSGEKT